MRPFRAVFRVAVVSVLLATGSWLLAPAHAQKKPIKIGFLAPLTGAAAQIGRDMENGFTMYLEAPGHQMAGRKVELIVEDTAGNPGTAITKFRKFVESDRVDMVVVETFAHIGYALAPKADEYKMPTIFCACGSSGDAACGAGGVMAWERGRREGGARARKALMSTTRTGIGRR